MGRGSAEGAAGPSNKGRAPMRLLKCPGCHAGRTARDHEAIDRKLIVAAPQLERPEPRSCFPLLATDDELLRAVGDARVTSVKAARIDSAGPPRSVEGIARCRPRGLADPRRARNQQQRARS